MSVVPPLVGGLELVQYVLVEDDRNRQEKWNADVATVERVLQHSCPDGEGHCFRKGV